MKVWLFVFAVISPPLCAAAGEPDLGRERLDDIFSGNTAVSLPDARELPAVPEAKWVNGIAQAQLEEYQLNKHGAKLSESQMADVEDALARLMVTDYGYELCRAVSRGCGARSFKQYGIEIRVRPMKNALGETPAYSVGTKKVITLSQDLLDSGKFKPGDIAAVLAHELSHVQDVAKYNSPLLGARLATEKKAYMATLAVYTELYDYDRESVSTDYDLYTMMQAWRYKFEGGPPPDGVYIDGRYYSGEDFAAAFIPGQVSQQGFIHAMTRYYYPEVVALNQEPGSWAITMELQKTLEKRAAAYAEWRIEHNMDLDSYYNPPMPPVAPVQPVTPPVQPVTPPVQPVTPPVQPVTPPVQPVTPPVQPVTPPVHPVTPPDDGDDDNGGDDGDDDGGVVNIGPDNPLYPD